MAWWPGHWGPRLLWRLYLKLGKEAGGQDGLAQAPQGLALWDTASTVSVLSRVSWGGCRLHVKELQPHKVSLMRVGPCRGPGTDGLTLTQRRGSCGPRGGDWSTQLTVVPGGLEAGTQAAARSQAVETDWTKSRVGREPWPS